MRVPPAATFSTWAPRHNPRTGSPALWAAATNASSQESRAASTPYASGAGSPP